MDLRPLSDNFYHLATCVEVPDLAQLALRLPVVYHLRPLNPRPFLPTLQEQVRAMTSTDPATVAEVSAFLAAKGAKCEVFPHSLKCSASVASVEKMLNTRVHAFKQTTRSNKLVHRVHPDEDYTFPREYTSILLC